MAKPWTCVRVRRGVKIYNHFLATPDDWWCPAARPGELLPWASIMLKNVFFFKKMPFSELSPGPQFGKLRYPWGTSNKRGFQFTLGGSEISYFPREIAYPPAFHFTLLGTGVTPKVLRLGVKMLSYEIFRVSNMNLYSTACKFSTQFASRSRMNAYQADSNISHFFSKKA